ncbi:homeodomain-like superfamily protein [Actinidia rufa]|uniref:Homeodomain-like superfamily protein n=1 Tax=Actinidia rufa TaxID=165716 RepID=A0A7J0ECT5_9ERIC|nr:homeodomain-like superfamily protein [Actinidia rufa]
MVSVNPNPPEGFFLDPTGMALPGLASFSAAAAAATTTTSSSDDLSKKIRKPYTITKSRESWTEPEHDKFLEALQLFDRDWKKIEAFVGSKSVIQIRSHAQKYFLKVQKSGTNEHLPPPRPKRKAAHPYPQKASKNAPVLSQLISPVLLEPGFIIRPESSTLVAKPVTSAAVSSRTDNSVQTVNLSHTTKGDMRSGGQALTNNCCSSTESTPRTWQLGDTTDQGNHGSSLRVLPDFAQVYNFIGSVFDPNASGHLHKLKKMDPIDVETVLLLMRNLSINLTSPNFEEHRRLLSSCEMDAEKDDSSGLNKNPP